MARAAAEGLANVTFLDPLPRAALGGLLAGSQIVLHLLADRPEFAEWTAPNKLMDGSRRPRRGHQPAGPRRPHPGAGPCGLAVPPGDAAALAAALARLAAEPGRRERLGAEGRRRPCCTGIAAASPILLAVAEAAAAGRAACTPRALAPLRP